MSKDKLVKFDDYAELNSAVKGKENLVILNMKDGSKYYLTNKNELSKYTNRPDVDSFVFFYEGDNMSVDAGTSSVDAGQTTVASVSVPSKPVEVPPKATGVIDPVSMTTAMVAGVIGASAGPVIAKFVKQFIKNQFKKEDKEDDEVTDCKTHQLTTNGNLASINSRLSQIDNRLTADISIDEDFDKLEGRVQKLEKLLKTLTKKPTKK